MLEMLITPRLSAKVYTHQWIWVPSKLPTKVPIQQGSRCHLGYLRRHQLKRDLGVI